jgi:hypothetical protein
VNHSNRRTLQLLTLSPLALALAMSASAATRNELHNQNVSLLNSQYKLAAASGMPANPRRHAECSAWTPIRLTVLTHNQDADGTKHYRYQQTFRGSRSGASRSSSARTRRQHQEPVRRSVAASAPSCRRGT